MGDRIIYGPNNPRLPIFMSRFRELVEEHGGITEVVNKTGISRPTVTFWANGQRTPDGFNLKILCGALGVSSDYLLGISSSKSLEPTEQAACAYSGLNKTTIAAIRQLDDDKLDMLNKVLTSDKFPLFLTTLAEVKANEQKVKDNIKKINGYDYIQSQTGIKFDKAQATIDELYRYYGVLYFLTDSTEKLAEDVCGVKLSQAYLRKALDEVYHSEWEESDDGN